MRAGEGKLYLYVAIDRTSKFAFATLVDKASHKTASAFLVALIKAIPYKIHTVLTENGVEHGLTKPYHPWTNGQVERMNRTIKEAAVRRHHYGSRKQLRTDLQSFIDAYNCAKRLKTLKGLTPYGFSCKCWTAEPKRFTLNPLQDMPGLSA